MISRSFFKVRAPAGAGPFEHGKDEALCQFDLGLRVFLTGQELVRSDGVFADPSESFVGSQREGEGLAGRSK